MTAGEFAEPGTVTPPGAVAMRLAVLSSVMATLMV